MGAGPTPHARTTPEASPLNNVHSTPFELPQVHVVKLDVASCCADGQARRGCDGRLCALLLGLVLQGARRAGVAQGQKGEGCGYRTKAASAREAVQQYVRPPHLGRRGPRKARVLLRQVASVCNAVGLVGPATQRGGEPASACTQSPSP